jgi:cell division septation protein DedD
MMLWKFQPLLLASLLTAGSAWAKNVDSRDNEARAACLSGDYAKGIEILSQLFVQTKAAGFIFNQGRCFEQNHRYDDAIARFEEFLRVVKKLSKADKAEAQQHIADCRKSLENQSTAATPVTDQSSKEAKERAARKACLTGDPAAGVAILTDLYLDTKDPTHLFNQGRCFEQNQRYRDAIGRFREYLVKAKGLSAGDKADTEQHIANCDSYLREAPVEAAAPEVPKPSVAKPVGSERKPAEVVTASPAENAIRSGHGLRIAGGVVAAVGVAGLVTGLVLNLKVNSMSGDLEADWNPTMDSTRKDYRTATWIAYGAGAACVVGGSVLYYLGWRRGEGEGSVAVVPTVGPDMAGALVVGAF